MTKKFSQFGLSHGQILRHMMEKGSFIFVAIAFALFIGMLGYRHFEDMTWVDAFSNAAMILSGMGPLTPLKTTPGKIFAGAYALFSGLAFIVFMGVLLSPIIHRYYIKLENNLKK